MKTRASSGILLAVTMAAGFLGVWRLQESLDKERSKVEVERDDLALRSPALLKKLSLEYAPLMAAIYWTRAVQYYGQKHYLRDQNLELLWPLLDISSTLDPNLIVVYRFGAIFLSDAPPRGAGEPEKAVQLLERGIKANPDYWRFYQDLGNVYYFDEKNYLKASQAFEEGSRNPAAMSWMKMMAAKIAAEGESLETSYALWLDIYQTTTSSQIRENAGVHLRLVKAQIDLRNLDQLADEFAKRSGKPARSISALVQAGLLPGQPVDPDGFPYVMGEDGKAELNPKNPLREQWLREKK